MSAFTAKNRLIGRAPKITTLLGDKEKKVESAQHIIEFPGGAIEVSRTTEGNYWAHIIVNSKDTVLIEDGKGFASKHGRVINSRVDHNDGVIGELPRQEEVYQVAVLVRAEDD